MASVSLRRVRQATGETIANVKAQADAIERLGTDLGTVAGMVGAHELHLAGLPQPTATVWDRLRWLVTGH